MTKLAPNLGYTTSFDIAEAARHAEMPLRVEDGGTILEGTIGALGIFAATLATIVGDASDATTLMEAIMYTPIDVATGTWSFLFKGIYLDEDAVADATAAHQ